MRLNLLVTGSFMSAIYVRAKINALGSLKTVIKRILKEADETL
jgi:hypothetical protein